MNVTLELDIGLNNNKNDNEKENLQNNFIDTKSHKYFTNNSFGDLTLSDIGNKDKNSIRNSQRSNYKETENDDMHNNVVNEFQKRGSLGSVIFEDFNQIFRIKKKKLKLSKEDLNNIPLPIFSCIYCSNELISFKHFLNDILSKKYMLLTSIFDIQKLNMILSQKYLIDKYDENDKLEDIIIKNTEYIKKYYIYDESKNILSTCYDDKTLFEIHQKKYIEQVNNILNKIKLKKSKKNINKIPSLTKKYYHYYSFNSNVNNNSSINNLNNSIDVAVELNINNNNKKIIPFNINQTSSNLSASNFNSVSLINYFDNNLPKEKENRFKLDDIIEQIEKNSAVEDFSFDLNRKIKRSDIEWEKEYYNIWAPSIESLISQNQYIPTANKNNFNQTFIKIQKSNNNTFYKKAKDNITTIKKRIARIPSRENEKMNNKGSKNKSKNISPNNIKIIKKHTIAHIFTHSNSKNYKRNILINLNDTPKLQNYTQTKIKMYKFFKKGNSHKNLMKISSNKSLNKKKKFNLNPINLFNSSNNLSKLKSHKIMKNHIPLNISIINKSTNLMKKAKSKINLGKSLINNKNDIKEKTNRNKVNKNKFFSQNSSICSKKKIQKIELFNAIPKKVNELKRNNINFKNKIIRNNTYQNLDNIKEKSVIINIINDGSYDSPTRISPKIKNAKIESKAIGVNNKINKSNLSNYKKTKDKKISNVHIKNTSGNRKTNLNKENVINCKKNSYNVKILIKKNIEIKIKNSENKKNI